jgi:hypothetical protein
MITIEQLIAKAKEKRVLFSKGDIRLCYNLENSYELYNGYKLLMVTYRADLAAICYNELISQ